MPLRRKLDALALGFPGLAVLLGHIREHFLKTPILGTDSGSNASKDRHQEKELQTEGIRIWYSDGGASLSPPVALVHGIEMLEHFGAFYIVQGGAI